MANAFVLTNAWVRINNVDLSDHCSEVHVNLEADQVEVTAMGSYARTYLQGLKAEGFEATFFSDFAATKVDATLQPLYASGSAFLMEVAAQGATISATNPKYSGSVILFAYTPISGAVGDASQTTVTFAMSGSTISRATV